MKQWKRIKQKLLAGLLCAVLVVTDASLTGIPVLANELETEVVKEDFYEDEVTTASADTAETDAFEENAEIADTQQEEVEPYETESVVEEESSTTMVTDEEDEVYASEIENKADSQPKLKLVEKEELTGAYQFGGAPSKEDNGLSVYSIKAVNATNMTAAEDYLYQQMKERQETIDVESYNISQDKLRNFISGVLNEHPDLYFVKKEFSYSLNSSNTIIKILITYDNSLDDNMFQKAEQEALSVVKTGMSDLEKAIALHDYLAVNCEYDKENLNANTVPATSYTAYGALVERIAVCQGYALAYKYLLSQVGIDCYMVTSDTMNHAWNLIELNGNYYQVDVTWDDPTWDLIGRARHQYMFRSDDAFVNECKHYDWSVTKGSEVVAYEATDTSYDSAFWVDCDAPLVLVGKDCYYVTYDEGNKTGVINKTSLSDITGTGESICDIGKWTVWENASGYYTSAFSGLFQVSDRLYYNDKLSIYSIALDSTESNMDKRTEFTADTTNGYIYGSAFCQGKVLYSLHQTPNMVSKETVLTADITFEIAVEKIELDKSTVTLKKGETVELKASVTPSYATDVTVVWASSDSSVAVVEDGVVTAVSEGDCTITASVGDQKVICTVTVTADKETYTVIFELQGYGTALQEYSTYTQIEKGSTIKCPTSPQAEGYEFTGWYKDADCQTLWDFEKDTVEKDIILYAGWKESEKAEEKSEEKSEEESEEKSEEESEERSEEESEERSEEESEEKLEEESEEKSKEESEKKPLINNVLFPKQKSEYSAVYTGEQIRPVMIVAYQYTDDKGNAKTQKLKLNVDYTVYYSNNVNVGTAEVIITGIGEYTGSITKKFTIEKKSISGVTLSPVGDIVFGENPSVTVTDGTHELVENRDYNVVLSATGSAGADTPSVLTVEGIGNYTGTSKKSVQFNILKKGTDILSIADKSIQVEFKKFPAKGYTYNGKAQKPGVVVTDTTTGKKLSSSMYKVLYSNNINAGKKTAKAWIVGVSKNDKGYYGMSTPMYFDISQKYFSKVSASLRGTIPKTGSIQDIKKAIDEAILVKDGKHVLSENEYTIDYGDIKTVNDIKIGTTYQITLAPKAGGNYIEGSQKVIKIKFGQLNLASKTAMTSVEIIDASQNEIAFYYNGILLEKDKDYTATIKEGKNYTIKIKAVKNSAYKGSKTYTLPNSDWTEKDPNLKPAVSNNKNAQNYCWYNNYNWNWADTVKSYLYENQTGGLTRVEYIDGKIVAEDYDNDFKLCASRNIPMELSIWGGFYAGDQYNFVIFGQQNASQNDNTEVVRVVKYSKDWKRLGEAKLRGANTVAPFEAGSLRCAEYGDYLYIRTCHEMYASSDGLNHQANMTLAVRQSDMTITDSFFQVMNSSVGYVSHSFNQFVLVDQDQNLVTLDHGDAYPRGIVLMRPVNAKAGGDKFSGRFENSGVITIPGMTGDNRTGASVGGFAETQNGYVTAFNYDGAGSNGSRAVYIGYTSKSDLASQATPITAYDGMLTPVLAPTGLDGGYLMWTDSKDEFYYTRYADGGTVGTTNTADASLSDCQPILHNGEIVWYVTSKSVPTFFKLDVSSSTISKIVAKS